MNTKWQTKKIGEICDLLTGGTPSKSKPEYFKDGTIKWLVSGDINKRVIHDCDGRITEKGLQNSNAKYLPMNSVMIALNGQGKTRGTVAMLRIKATCNQSLVCINPKDPKIILSEYIYCNLNGRYEEIRKMTGDTGNDRRGLNMSLIKKIEIPFPPLPEQKRIVSILDASFDAVKQAKENAEKNLQNAHELFESYLQSVFVNPREGWVRCNLEGQVRFIDYRGKTPKKMGKGLRLITAKNVKMGYLQRHPEEFVAPEVYDGWMVRGIPKLGDVLFTTEAPLANVAQLDTDEKVVFAQRIIILQPKTDVLNQAFLKYLLLSQPMQKLILEKGTGATVKGIKASLLKKIEIYFPKSLPEQQAIVSKLDALSSQSKQLESIYQQKLNHLAELKQSLLTKAFAGEL